MKRIQEITSVFATPDYLVNRKISVSGKQSALLYNPDMTDTLLISRLVVALEKCHEWKITAKKIANNVSSVAETSLTNDVEKARNSLLSGDAIVVVDGVDEIVVINLRKWDKRAIAEPPTATVMRGPREGFIEDVKTNLSLLERRLKSPAFAIEKLTVGRISNTTVAIVYLSNVVDKALVREVRARIKSIDVDAIIDSHYLQPYLEDRPFSLFHQTGVTEKPDIVASKLLEGRVAIIVDGSPMVITIPFMLIEDYQSSEDYYERASLSTFLRIIRVLALFFSILLPGLYVALEQYHYSVIPMRFLLTVMTAVNGIPLSPITEILFVILLFELIREASVRMPRAVGMAMSIVGALVLGDTAVKAGIISSPAVMITALSSIALYTAPNQEGTLTLLRVVFTLIGGLGGMYLLLVGILYLLLYLCSLNGFGVQYMAPFAPLIQQDLGDSVYRVSLLRMDKRPVSIKNINANRYGDNNGKR
jgi:spore germination protein KA